MEELQTIQTDDKNIKMQIIAAALMAPLLGGAIIYYSLKKSHLAYAKLGNLFSFLGLLPWLGLYYSFQAMGLSLGMISGPLSMIGIVLAVLLVMKVQKQGK